MIKSLLCVGQHSRPRDKAENKIELIELTIYLAIRMNKLIKHLVGASEEGPGPCLWREDPGLSGLGDIDTGTLTVGGQGQEDFGAGSSFPCLFVIELRARPGRRGGELPAREAGKPLGSWRLSFPVC